MIKLKLETPPVKGYLHHAYHLSVAQEHPSFIEWFNSNYIQLRYYPKNNWLNFYKMDQYPLLDVQIVKNEFLRVNQIDIIDFTVNSIKQGYYVWLYIDEYYDPNRESYNKKNQVHENLLYGYNQDYSCFYTAGFDQKQIYSFSEIRFSDFLKAYNVVPDHFPVKMLKLNENFTYHFNLQYVKEILTDYIYSKNTSERNGMLENSTSDCFYGIDSYKYLKIYFENVLKDEIPSDIRLLHILLEHKDCMLSRIKYLSDNKYLMDADPIIDSYREIQKKVLTLRNLQLMYDMKGNKKYLYRLINYIDEIAIEEPNILIQLLEGI
jgi:hypothetical protein